MSTPLAIIPEPERPAGGWVIASIGRMPRGETASMANSLSLVRRVRPYEALGRDAYRSERRFLDLLRTLLRHGIETGFFPKSRLWDFVTRP
jgi:hypothetical protein